MVGHHDGRHRRRSPKLVMEEPKRQAVQLDRVQRPDVLVLAAGSAADALVIIHALTRGLERVSARMRPDSQVGPQRPAEIAHAVQGNGVIHQDMDAMARGRVPTTSHLVVESVAIVAAVPPEVVVPGHVDRRDAGQPVREPVEGARQRRMDVAGDDRDIEAAGRRTRRRVPGVVRPVLVQIGKDPEPRHGGLLEMDASDRRGRCE